MFSIGVLISFDTSIFEVEVGLVVGSVLVAGGTVEEGGVMR